MSVFRCEKCGCVENTATSNYWTNRYPEDGGPRKTLLCSECDPEIGKWHGCFDKRSAKGLFLATDGFLYSKEDIDGGLMKRMSVKVVSEVKE